MKDYWIKLSKYGIYVILAIMTVFIGIVYFATLDNQGGRPQPQPLSFTGEYIADSGLSGEVTDEFKLSASEYPSITMTGHFDRDIDAGEVVSFHIKYLDVNVYKNGELIYNYKQGGDGRFKYGSIVWGSFVSDGITTSDDIVIELNNPYIINYSSSYSHLLSWMYTGDRNTLFLWLLRKNWISLLAGLLMGAMGLFLTIFILATRLTSFKMYKGALYSSLFMLVVGIWSITDFSYMPLFYLPTGYLMILENCLLFAQVPLLIGYLHCLSKTSGRYIFRVVELTSSLFLAGFIVQTLLGLFDTYNCRMVFLVFAFVWSVLCIIASIFELEAAVSKDDKFIWGTGIIAVICSLLEILNVRADIFQRDTLLRLSFYLFALAQIIVSANFIRNSLGKARRVSELEKEQLESQMSIMVSQIQPHFLYNSLTVIQQLCDIDPQMAKEAVAYFAKYLRGNMDSLNQSRPIPLVREIKHVENYLALEKMRFDDINIIYDIKSENFMLPALSIQPIVENAVRYGVSKCADGGTITIATDEDDNNYMVVVTDNGAGFDTEVLEAKLIAQRESNDADTRSHIGIENVRRRLNLMCHGTLEIKSEIGVGTTVVITIPKEGNNENNSSR